MHSHIKKLHDIANKQSRLIIGLMSGTSLDGLDIALCKLSGNGTNTSCDVLKFVTYAYDSAFKEKIKQVFAKKHGSIEQVCLLNAYIGAYHGTLIKRALAEFEVTPQQVDVIASHGQTIYHSPAAQHQLSGYPNATLQIGDGDHIAVHTGIITISDFRQKHIAAGGEGAPLVMYGDYLLFNSALENRILLNIGGIANFTYLPQSADFSRIFSTDIGPGNTMMDGYMQAHFQGQYYDENAQVSSAGSVNIPVLTELLKTPFFTQSFPKTTGPEVFNLALLEHAKSACGGSHLSHEDTMATLCEFSAVAISEQILKAANDLNSVSIYTSGGGVHNPLLMQRITHLLNQGKADITIRSIADLSIHPDAKEAVLFALLANETLCGDGELLKQGTSALPCLTLGKISFYD